MACSIFNGWRKTCVGRPKSKSSGNCYLREKCVTGSRLDWVEFQGQWLKIVLQTLKHFIKNFFVRHLRNFCVISWAVWAGERVGYKPYSQMFVQAENVCVCTQKPQLYAQKCIIALASLVRIREARTSFKNRNRLEKKKNDKGASFCVILRHFLGYSW